MVHLSEIGGRKFDPQIEFRKRVVKRRTCTWMQGTHGARPAALQVDMKSELFRECSHCALVSGGGWIEDAKHQDIGRLADGKLDLRQPSPDGQRIDQVPQQWQKCRNAL